MDILISIGVKIAEYTVEPVGHQLGYLCFYKRNIDELKAQIIHLGHAEERLQRRVDDAKRNGEEIEADVKELLTNIRKMVEDNEKFIRDEEQANTKCCTGAFSIPNLVLRFRLNRRAKKTAQDVVTQIKDVEECDKKKISYCPHLPSLVEVKGYEEFESRNRILTEIMKGVRDPNVRVLGVWGMGGVGKTMLTKKVARLAKDEEKLFSEVVFTTISATPNIEKIQEDIGKCLGMDKHYDIGERIKNRLTKENNILVIVDDVWEKIELEDVGISLGKDHKGCKIIVTSRYQNVLNNMDVDKIFQVRNLLEDEAMNLFRKIVGDKAKEHDFQAVATEIVKECGGLPIAITTVASALKTSPHQVWNNALYELRKSDPVNIGDMDKKVYSSIKLSYDFLQSKEAKKLLLLCSLFEEDEEIPIEFLCNYGIGLNLFEGTSKLEVATNKTITLVETLKDHSLLLSDNKVGDINFVRLHDVIRDVVISIASKDDEAPMYNFRDAVELEEFLVTEKLEKSTAISLYHIKADGYPETLKSPKLKLLRLIHGYQNKVEFQHHFFEGLDQLFVLDLEGASLEPSPASSFCLLQNLQTLRLIDCHLGDISWIGELNNLKILHLSNSSITELPKEIGKLNRLLSLNLQWCQSLKVIRPNVISRLTRLEELNLDRSFKNWEDGEGVVNGDDERPNASLGEVKNLRHLTNLSLTVPDVKILPNNMFSDKLDKFNLQIGTVDPLYFYRMSSRMLTLKLCPDSVLKEHDFEVLLKRSESLHLIGLKSASNVAYELDSIGFPQLEELRIEDSTEILCILNSNGNTDNRAAFGKLRRVDVSRCHKMKSLFPICNTPKQLESISVEDCEMMEEIISNDGREGDLLKIFELSYLNLNYLPKLVQFQATRKSDEIRVDEAQSIDDSVVPLFDGEVLFPKLEDIRLEGLNVGKFWIGDHLRSSEFGFKSLTKIIVRKCDQLKGLIPSSVVRSLVNLYYLAVDSCKAMEEVVFMEESTLEAKTFENMSFPKLVTLRLDELPNLKGFYAGDYINIDCPSLLKLEINNCPKLREFLTNTIPTIENENFEDLLDQVDKQLLFNHKVVFPKLKRLVLARLNIEKIWNGNHLRSLDFVFQSLTSLIVDECDPLKSLIPSSVVTSLIHLKYLAINNCKFMEEVVFMEESTQEVKTCENISFPKLETLQLDELPNLKRFYAGDYINIDCPSLLNLEIKNCPKLEEFLTNTMPMTENENFEDLWNQVDKQLFFNHKVVFAKLKSLELARLNIGKIWNGDQLRSSEFGFQSLQTLIVDECDQLKGLIPSSVVRSFVHLEFLEINDCKAMKEVVFMEESIEEVKTFENISFPKLETLRLWNLPNLKRFYTGEYINIDCPLLWNLEIRNCPKLLEFSTNTMPTTENENFEDLLDDQVDKQLLFNHKVLFPKLEVIRLEGINVGKFWNGDQLRSLDFGFKNIKNLCVLKCDELKGLIPSSVARNLVHLEYVEVESCRAIEEVVFIEEFTQEAFENISFPKLKSLRLSKLPNLRFYAWDCVDCSSLKLGIENCPAANENIEALEQVDKQPLLIQKDLKKADQLIHTESSCSDEFTLEPRQLGGVVQEHYDTGPFRLPNMEQLHKTFQNVETLEIFECDGLKVFTPPSMSLQSLTILKVESCSGLTSTLFHRSIAKSLSQLKKLSIFRCPNLRQVIANDNKKAHDDLDEIADDIVFSQLETLRLFDLCSLEIFYSGYSVLKFPRLKTLVVDHCLRMKTFSHGDIEYCSMLDKIVGRNTSNQNLTLDDDIYDQKFYIPSYSDWWKFFWEGDINTTIQKLWKDENDSSFTKFEENMEDSEEED